jgi:hypothetical protein
MNGLSVEMQGKSLGCPLKLTAHQRAEAIARREKGDETLAEIGRSYNVSGAMISRLTIQFLFAIFGIKCRMTRRWLRH